MKSPKFRRYTGVKIDDEMPKSMSHFEKGNYAIVKGTYRELHRGSMPHQEIEYSLYLLEGGKVVNCVSWYGECQLTAVPEMADVQRNLDLIEDYELGRNRRENQ